MQGLFCLPLFYKLKLMIMKKLIVSIYMQIGVTIIGLPDLLDFSRYENIMPKYKNLAEPKSKYIP